MSFKAVDNLSEQIAQHLSLLIIKGELKEKERIPETKIAEELGVSRGSIRESLLILQSRYMVEIYPRRGAVVSEVSRRNAESLYDLYIVLLTHLMVSLAEKWETTEDIAPLVERINDVEQLRNRDNAGEALIEVGFNLLDDCCAIVNNVYLTETMSKLKPALHRTYYRVMLSDTEGFNESQKFLIELASLVSERDRQSIEETVRAFGTNQKTMVLQSI